MLHTIPLRIVLFCLLGISLSQVHLGLDMSGKIKMAYDGDSSTFDTDTGLIVGYEKLLDEADELSYGLGGEFMFGRGVEEFSTGKAAFHSIYGYGKYGIDDKLYAYGRVGYNIHTGDDDYTDGGDGVNTTLEGGMMYSFGGGYSLNQKVNLEGLFSTHSGSVKFSASGYEDITIKLTYTRFTIGVRINL